MTTTTRYTIREPGQPAWAFDLTSIYAAGRALVEARDAGLPGARIAVSEAGSETPRWATAEELKQAASEPELELLVAECQAAARDAGELDEDAEEELTAADCEWIVEALGRKPTRSEWREAGLRYVGEAHVGEGRPGRKPRSTAAAKPVSVRLTAEEHGRVQAAAERAGQSVSDYARARLLGHLTDDEVEGHLDDLGETGSAKVERGGLYTRREENAGWLYCGSVADPDAVRSRIEERAAQ